MKPLLFFIAFSLAQLVFSQEDFLAKQYFNDGDYEKAVVFYEKLVESNPRRTDYIEDLIACYQQLERYQDAETLLQKKIAEKNAYPTFYIELGRNYTLQNNATAATKYYEMALSKIRENSNFGYAVGAQFQKYVLLDYAVKAYSLAMELNPKFDYNFQLARIYGEQGDIEKMYQSYLVLIQEGRSSQSNVLRNISDFITSDAEHENNIKLKKILLQNAQTNADLIWNELLSWLFIKQKDFRSAFNQEKAIYKREGENSLQRLEALGGLALEENESEIATTIFEYIVTNGSDPVMNLNAELSLITIAMMDADAKKLTEIERTYENLMTTYGYENQTLQLQVAYANFLTFKKDTPEPAIAILKKALDLPLNKFGEAYIKMALGEILV